LLGGREEGVVIGRGRNVGDMGIDGLVKIGGIVVMQV
jgi:hypothetical protein